MTRRRTSLYCSAFGVLTLLLTAQRLWGRHPGDANPLPGEVLLVHIQPVDPDFCDEPTITTCEEIVQHTAAAGQLEFDVFSYPLAWLPYAPDEIGLTSFAGEISWPAEWNLVSAEICNGGEGSIETNGPNQLTMDAEWPDCPGMNLDKPVLPVARIVLDVTVEGELRVETSGCSVGCPDSGTYSCWPDTGIGRAGGECGWCARECGMGWPCRLYHFAEILEIEVEEGASVMQSIDATAGLNCPPYPMAIGETSDEWLGVDIIWQNGYDCTIDVTADAGDLGQGVYQGWVRSVLECATCTPVIVTVLPPAQGIPEDQPTVDSRGLKVEDSWGRIKALYR